MDGLSKVVSPFVNFAKSTMSSLKSSFVTPVAVAPERWFSALFGFDEAAGSAENQKIDPAVIRSKFVFDEATGLLKSRVNGAAFESGVFRTPSLQELRELARQKGILNASKPSTAAATTATTTTKTAAGGGGASSGSSCESSAHRLVVKHMATSDVFALHARPEFAGAVFMAASQFNCLEFPHPSVVPEDGVTDYIFDGTQGPACALATPASTVVRNYFVKTGARGPGGEELVGQTGRNQIDNLAQLLKQLTRVPATTSKSVLKDSSRDDEVVSVVDGRSLVLVQNGYTSSNDRCLTELNRRIAAATEGSPQAREDLLGRLRVGVHSNAEVPWGTAGRFELLPPPMRHKATQVYCSAVACNYSSGRKSLWEPLARLVLDASYEAVLLTAALEACDNAEPPTSSDDDKTSGKGKAFLTFLGGGVFGNESEWIENAIARACVRLQHTDLEVIVCHYGSVKPAVARRINAAIDVLRASDDDRDDGVPRAAAEKMSQ